ncbi:UDP-N-acetylglucosamine 2-epimerase (hydrolyzing) [Candidatus Uhrbacteria bacterium]|nr:UDP-N-acetylglucosamine 2-epimerase (hydrolyzing) [Candidatus Uhrbacteria bacterium]
MKKILALTGIRSEYYILYPVINALRKDEQFDVRVVVSGAHLSDWHGLTLREIEADGFHVVDKIDSQLMTNRTTQRVKGVGMLTYALAQTVEREKPDVIFVVGDREESIAAALVGNYMDVAVAHLGGGDPVYGNADDPIRFAVSKLAHIHFTLADAYAKNLQRVGEEEFRIFNVGDPALDTIRTTPARSLSEISNILKFDITDGHYVVFIRNPLSSEWQDAGRQMHINLQALERFSKESGYKVVAIHPNTDPGAHDIVEAIQSYKDKPFIKFYKNLEREIFVNVMRHARALVGNSSMGLLEAPFYKLPVVNVGNRQQGRLNAGNVEFVPDDLQSITQAIHKACTDEEYRAKVAELKNPFGNGYTSEKIRDVLRSIDLSDKQWLIKKNLVGIS